MIAVRKFAAVRVYLGLSLLWWMGVFSGCGKTDEAVDAAHSMTPAPAVPVVKLDLSQPSPHEIGSVLRVYRGKPPLEARKPFLGEKVRWAGTFTGATSHRDEAVLEFQPEEHPIPVITVLGMTEVKDSLAQGKSYIIEGIIEGAHGSQIVLSGISIKPDPR